MRVKNLCYTGGMAKKPTKIQTLRKRAITYLSTPSLEYEDTHPAALLGLPPDAEKRIQKYLHGANQDERMKIDLEVAKIWHERLQRQHTDLLERRAHLMEKAQASTLQHISLAVGISADQIKKSQDQIDDLISRLGEGEVIEPTRVIHLQGGDTVEA